MPNFYTDAFDTIEQSVAGPVTMLRTDRDRISESALESDDADGGGEIISATVVACSSSPDRWLFQNIALKSIETRTGDRLCKLYRDLYVVVRKTEGNIQVIGPAWEVADWFGKLKLIMHKLNRDGKLKKRFPEWTPIDVGDYSREQLKDLDLDHWKDEWNVVLKNIMKDLFQKTQKEERENRDSSVWPSTVDLQLDLWELMRLLQVERKMEGLRLLRPGQTSFD